MAEFLVVITCCALVGLALYVVNKDAKKTLRRRRAVLTQAVKTT